MDGHVKVRPPIDRLVSVNVAHLSSNRIDVPLGSSDDPFSFTTVMNSVEAFCLEATVIVLRDRHQNFWLRGEPTLVVQHSLLDIGQPGETARIHLERPVVTKDLTDCFANVGSAALCHYNAVGVLKVASCHAVGHVCVCVGAKRPSNPCPALASTRCHPSGSARPSGAGAAAAASDRRAMVSTVVWENPWKHGSRWELVVELVLCD